MRDPQPKTSIINAKLVSILVFVTMLTKSNSIERTKSRQEPPWSSGLRI